MTNPTKKNLKNSKNKRMLYIFFTTFFLSMFIVGFLIKTLSPSVDVEIGDGQTDVEETESSVPEEQSNVDDRLKWIQFEDNMPGVSKRFEQKQEEMLEPSYEGDVKDKLNNEEKVRESKTTTQPNLLTEPKQTKQSKLAPPVPTSSDVNNSVKETVAPIKMTKVYVGYYTNIEQAISVQNRLIDSNLNVSPFVKEVNGYYVVQVGSYANKQKAQTLYSEISTLGFPAKIVSE